MTERRSKLGQHRRLALDWQESNLAGGDGHGDLHGVPGIGLGVDLGVRRWGHPLSGDSLDQWVTPYPLQTVTDLLKTLVSLGQARSLEDDRFVPT